MLKQIKNRQNWMAIDNVLLKFFLLLIVFATVTTAINAQPWYNIILFSAYQIFVLLLPGMAIMLLFRFQIKTDIEFMTISYLMGYIFNILLYYITVPVGIKAYLPILAIVIGVLSAWVVLKCKKNLPLEVDKKGSLICGIFIIVLLTVEQFAYSGIHMLVPQMKKNVYSSDLLYWIGNIIALMKQYPPKEFRLFRDSYNYHYFSSMQLAVFSFVTDIRPMVAGFCYSFFQPIMLLILGAYTLLRSCSRNKKIIIGGIIALIFTTGLEKVAMVSYTNHLITTPFGFDVGIGVFLILLYMLLMQHQEKEFNWKIFVLTMLQFGILAGVKAPLSVIAVMLVGFLCFSWLVRKQYKKALGYGIPILCVFLLVYIFVSNVSGYSEVGTMEYIQNAINWESNATHMKESLQIFTNLTIPKPIIEMLFIIKYSIISNSVIYTLFWVMIVLKLALIRKWDSMDTACVLSSIIGVCLTLYITMYGISQMYFIMATYPVALIFIARGCNSIWEQRERFGKVLHYCTYGILMILFLFGIRNWYTDSEVNGFHLGIEHHINKGLGNYIHNLQDKDTIDEDLYKKYQSNYVDRSMYEGFEFIRTNTQENDVIACDRDTWVIGTFTERYIIYREDYQELFESGAVEELKNMNVKYLLHTKEEQYSSRLLSEVPPKYGELIFDNEAVSIYKLK